MDHYDEHNYTRIANDQAPRETPNKKFVSTGYLTGYVVNKPEQSEQFNVVMEIMKYFKKEK